MLTTTAAGRTWDYSHVIGCASVSDRGFRIPLAVKCAADGTLFVLNRGGERPVDDGIQMDGQRIGMLTLDEVYLGEFATGEFVWPVDLALDTEGLVYVSDQFRRTVSVYQRDGGRMGGWGGPGRGVRWPWRQDAFCALGVLYDLYLKSNKKEWPASTPGRLPASVLSWVGVSRRFEETIIMHNDMQITFRDIANIVEAHFERLVYWQRSERADQIAIRAIEKAKQMTKYCNRLAKVSVD